MNRKTTAIHTSREKAHHLPYGLIANALLAGGDVVLLTRARD